MLQEIPRGVEVLVKKAAVDPAFMKTLIAKRGRAADDIALKLSPAEEAMLAAVPEAQLRAIVANTKVSPGLRPAFLGATAGAMLAALGTVAYAEESEIRFNPTTGIRAEPPADEQGESTPLNIADIVIARYGVELTDDAGVIAGTVIDESGLRVIGALVKIKKLGLFITSDGDGIYYFANVPPGKYKVFCSRVGYGAKERKIEVRAGKVNELSFVLKSEAAGGIRPDRP